MKSIIKYCIEFLIMFTIPIVLFNNCIIVANVSGSSMYPTIYDSDKIVSSKLNLDIENIDRFDIVEVYSSALNENIIKRVIAFPGETIEYVDDCLYVDGELYEQKFLETDYVQEYILENGFFTADFTYTVGENEVFVMGDNRPYSTDSRVLGGIDLENIIGKRGIIITPISRIGWLD